MAWNLPRPTGKYPVGYTDVLVRPGADGPLFRMYYPTKEFEPTVDVCPLWWESPEYVQGFADLVNKPKFLLNMFLGNLRVPVLRNGPLVMPDDCSQLPVIIFSHGLAGSRFFSSYVTYELASHGFLVACIEHRDRSAFATWYYEETGNTEAEKYKKMWLPWHPMPETEEERKELKNRQVHQRAKELSELMDCIESLNEGTLTNLVSDFDLSPFKNQIDVAKCALTGHSFGGGTIIVALQKDERFKVGVGMDPWAFPLKDDDFRTKMEKPFLYINADLYQNREDIVGMRMMDQDVTGTMAERKTVTLIGAQHLTFCDFTFFFRFKWVGKMMNMRGPTEPKDANAMNTKLILSYIRQHLELPYEKDVDTLVAENPTFVFAGSSFEIEEAEIQKIKDDLKAGKTAGKKADDDEADAQKSDEQGASDERADDQKADNESKLDEQGTQQEVQKAEA